MTASTATHIRNRRCSRYWSFCDRIVDDAVDALDLDSAESGFSWYRMSKLEHQLVNLRHIQHHGAQLADRLRSAADIGIRWVGGQTSGPAKSGDCVAE